MYKGKQEKKKRSSASKARKAKKNVPSTNHWIIESTSKAD
jgi:hypothetical protein